MGEWKEYKLNEIAEIFDHKRIPLSTMERQKRKGIYPYYGASGIIDYIDDFIFDGEYVLISEDGENLRTRQSPIAFIAKGKFWVNNHAHVIKGKNNYLNRLIVYYFKNLDLNPFLTGAVQPKLSKSTLLSIPIYLPEDITEQKAIASVLSSLDDKIDLLHRQNQTLEQMAQTLFRKWFIEDAKEDWEEVKLNQLVNIKYGKNLPTSKLLDKGYPVFGGNGLIGFYDEYLYDNPQVLISCRGAASGKVVITLPFSYITNNSLILEIKRDSVITFEFLKYYALNTDFTVYVSGSAQPQITINDLSDVVLILPKNKDLIDKFTNFTTPNETKILNNLNQIRTLEKLRDTLLPKLMSGELRVKV